MRFRDPNSGLNDGIYIPGWLRMVEDGSRRLRAGEQEVWDDLSVNVGVCAVEAWVIRARISMG